jgi:hypothetical protein
VLTVSGDRLSRVVFNDAGLFPMFGLPGMEPAPG